ncbi:transcription initiation factor TFIID subunit 4 [Microsporum canis CBS 113480]|uniref:Transcription initiation factor TFIID subunit 4 n=1 Tax=Arthroderma otae (strain ATCC MYA-4605 / CBS 113480) TaxID=554155 RepID=C5FQ67_ARTOC|nr:transcription initiation factor TFIID subunit 4 [Microsporum canis CBS 113480]EEQ32020.1 transcription initiation factor TFIID subunit 4 [Microsporum canis CBS 113480]
MQSRSASRGSQYIRGTRPKDRQHTQDQTQQTQEGVYQGYYDLNSPEHRQARYYSQDGQRKTADGQFQAYSPGASLSNISNISSNNISDELPEDEPVYLPSIGSFQSLHSLVNNLPTPGAVDRQASVSAASTAASSAASTFRSDTFSFSNGRPLASRSNSSLDRPASVAVGGGSAAGIRQARTVAARPMSSAARNESFHSNSSPVDRQAYQAVSAVRRATAAPRPICTAVRKDSYHAYSNSSPVAASPAAASPAASASSSSLDQGQAVNGQMQQPVIPAPTRRPPSPPPASASAVAAAVTTAVTAAVTAPVTAAVSPAARPRPAAIRNEAYHAFSSSSPATAVPVPAPSSSTSPDCQVPPGPASAAPTPTLRPTISTAARPMSAAAGNINNKSYHAYSSSNPVASASSASLDRLPPAAGAGAAVARRPSAMAARSHSYYGATCTTPVLGPAAPTTTTTTTTTMAIPAAIPAVTPVVQNLAASASTSSLDRQIPVAQRSASMAANPRPATAAVTRRATSHATLPRPASAVAGPTSYYGNAGPGLVARRNTIVFDGQQQQPQTQGQSQQGAQGQTGAEQATRPPRFYAMLRASMVVPDSVQIPTVEERQLPAASASLSTDPSPDHAPVAAPTVPEKTTTATTTNTATGTPASKAASSPPRSSTAISDFADLGTSARRAQSQARKLIKRNPSAPKPKLAPKPNAAQPSRSMSLAGAPPMPTSAPPSPPPLPRAMSIHIPPRSGSAAGAAKPTKTANKSKKLRLASLWSDLFRLRVSS